MSETKDIPIERVREHWQKAGSYPANKEDVYSGHAAAQEFEAAKGKVVLEYGCGGGSDAMSYLRRGAMVYFADVVPTNVAVANRRILDAGLGQNARPMALSESVPLALLDGTCDIVSSHGVLHHIVDPAPILKEFHRVLKPGGHLFVMLYSELLESRFAREIADLILRHGITRHEAFCWLTDEKGGPYARSYTTLDGSALLRGCGFRVVKTTEYNKGDFRCFKAERIG